MANVKTSAVVKAPPRPPQGVAVTAPNADAEGTITIPTPIAGLNLTFTKDQTRLNAEQMRVLAPLGIEADYAPGEVIVWLVNSLKQGFDPWIRETYLYKVGPKYVHHTGIEALRGKAEATREYEGQTPPQYAGPDGVWHEVWTRPGPPHVCRVGVYRKGFREPVYKPVYWDEYCPMIEEREWTGQGNKRRREPTGQIVPAPMWRSGQRGGRMLWMIQKCAEAAALRAAWPNKFQGLYIPEETEKSRREADAEKEAAADAAAERRKAAYDKAHGRQRPTGDTGTVEGEVVAQHDGGDPQIDDERLRDLTLTELAMQAQVLGRDVKWITGRWEDARGGRPWDTATAQEIADMVLAARPYVVDALRRAGRDAHADAYERAGSQILPVGQLLDDEAAADAAPGAEVAATGIMTASGER